ncbi:MAG: PrkA family serine protein kinase, partial [Halobacteriales archaeon]
ERYVEEADDTLRDAYDEPISLGEYVDRLLGEPRIGSHSAKYLLEAVEYYGTRTVVEEGEEKERYRFFDDPANNGEHAVLGNTDVLNGFVDTLRSIASRRGKEEKIVWIEGPTATGKSEFKRCLVNGLREYSKTEEGRRYTVEWNVSSVREWGSEEDENWYGSPTQAHPLLVFPRDVRDEILAEVNAQSDDHIDIRVDGELDPFSREAYDFLESRYRRKGTRDLFNAVTDERHLRVKNYVVDYGRGVGVLHSEDSGPPKQRLVGAWMEGMLQKLDSRGRKNPQAFSYDGVLSQGNSLLTVVEDAAQHADLLQQLLNVADEGAVKLDKAIRMDIDTVLVVVSNPDLEAQLDAKSEMGEEDPLKALKRRLEKHEFRYLTNLSLEAELLRREITNDTKIWEAQSDDYEEVEKRIASPVRVKVGDTLRDVREREIAPHAVEATAMYGVVTRLDGGDLPAGLDLVDKALLYDRGYLRRGDEKLEKDDFDIGDGDDGRNGIPVTYPRDVIADLLNDGTDRVHPELEVENVVMPSDVLDEMVARLDEEPMFSTKERNEYEERVREVRDYLIERQEDDVLNAMTYDVRVDDETVEEYVEHVYAWAEEETVETPRGEEEPDALKMKVFETEHLGRFGEDDYEGEEPNSAVGRFRRNKIVTAMNVQAWRARDEGFAGGFDPREIPVMQNVLTTYDWDDVRRMYDDFEPSQWRNPPTDTETERLKEKTTETLVDEFGYSPASAELTSRRVLEEVASRWG